MANQITETTLEMHFHNPLMDAIKACYGVGPKGHFSFYKYSQQKEKFIGFDQAYVRTELDDDEFYAEIKKAADGQPTAKKYAGYFLQFKVVEERTKKLKSIPSLISSTPPFYGVKLSTRRDGDGNLSQHELLRNIRESSNQALVYYACPMLFEKLDLYVDKPNLSLLRLVDVQSSNSDFSDNKTHHIFFKDKTSQPVWCSDPTDGTAITLEEFIGRVRESNATPQDHAQLLLKIIDQQQERISKEKEEVKLSDKQAAFADFLYLIQYSE